MHLHNWVFVFLPALLWTAPVSYYTSEEGNPDQNVTRICQKWTARFEQVIAWSYSLSLSGRRPSLFSVPRGYLHVRHHSFCAEESFGWWDGRREIQEGNLPVSIRLPSVLEIMWIGMFACMHFQEILILKPCQRNSSTFFVYFPVVILLIMKYMR